MANTMTEAEMKAEPEARKSRPEERCVISPTHEKRGVAHLTLIVFGTIFFCVGYYVAHVLPIWYGNWELESHMRSIIPLADQMSDDEIRRRLKITLREQKIPLAVEDIKIFRDHNHMILSASYMQTFKVVFRGKEYWRQEFKFRPYEEGDY